MQTLQPVEISEYYVDRVASGMRRYFWQTMFAAIFEVLADRSVVNSKSQLIDAIKSGKVYYQDGAFRGQFNNSISSTLEALGAKFRNNGYYIDKGLLPTEYVQAIAFAEVRAASQLAALNNLLQNVFTSVDRLEQFIRPAVQAMYKKLSLDIFNSAKDKNVPVIELGYVVPDFKIPKASAKSVEKYWQQYEVDIEKIKRAGYKAGLQKTDVDKRVTETSKKAFANAPKLQVDTIQLDAETQKVADDYVYNMQYWVQKWQVKNIVKMRQDVAKMVQDGARLDTIQQYFQTRWKIAKDKAYFLATNESNLATSVIKATHYQNMGFTHFRWGRSVSKEKRKLHEEYYDKIFAYSDPPIIDERLGIRGLPRQIWNCKCMQIPIVNEQFFEQARKIHNDKHNIFKKIFNSKQCNNNAWRYRRFDEGTSF